MDLLEEGNGAPFSIICRICLKAKQGMKSVYSSTIPDMLMYCVSLKVEHGDGLPNLICPHCLKQINQLFYFKQLCEKSETLLKQYLPLKIIPPQDLTVEDVTQNQILDTLEDPTLTSTSITLNESLEEPFHEQDIIETDILIPLVCLPHYEDTSLFSQEMELESERSMYALKDDDYSHSYLDPGENSWTGNVSDMFPDSANAISIADIKEEKGSWLKEEKSSWLKEEKGSFPCDKCKEVLLYREDLAVHLSLHSPGGLLQCNSCHKHFQRRESLRRHIKRHMKDKPLCCYVCQKKFSDKCDFKRHLKRCTLTQVKALGDKHPDKLQLSDIKKEIPKAPDATFQCHLCNHWYKKASSLTEHILKVHSDVADDQAKRKCNTCHMVFDKFKDYMSHQNNEHRSLPYKCYICNKAFPQKYRRKRHMLCHVKKGEVREVNGNYILEGDTEDVHIQVDDAPDNNTQQAFQDTPSDYSKQGSATSADKEAITGSVKQQDACINKSVFAALATDKEFSAIRNSPVNFSPVVKLTDIFANGTKQIVESSVECKICRHKVAKPKDLSIHMSLHPDIGGAWQCNVCNKHFSKKTFLTRHIRIHMTKERYPCPHCTKLYNEKSKLRRHVLKCHPEVSDTPPVSSEEEKSQTTLILRDQPQMAFKSLDQSQTSISSMDQSQTSVSSSTDQSQISIASVDQLQTPITDQSQISTASMDQSQTSMQYTDLSQTNQQQQVVLDLTEISPTEDLTYSVIRPMIDQTQFSVANSGLISEKSDGLSYGNLNIQTFVDCSMILSNGTSQLMTDTSPTLTYSTLQNVMDVSHTSVTNTPESAPQETENIHSCDVCGKSYSKAIKLSLHMRTHNLNQEMESIFTCQACPLTFSDVSTLLQHSNTHTHPHTCHTCNMTFTTSLELSSHMKLVHNTPTKPVPACKLCGKSFTSMYKRRKHMQLHKVQDSSSLAIALVHS